MTSTTVSYDARALTINGHRTLLLSGAIHYPRSTPAMWPAMMQRSKEAGLNAIETYVFWNLHERRRGSFDFSERLDLLRFCQLAQEYGLSVVLRIGPYICAETNYGGLPFWLRDVPGMRIRTYNQPFMDEMERWVRYLVEYVRPMFAPNGGPIILAQLENEYANIAKLYGEEGQRYLQWTADLGKSLDLGVPQIMCVGAASGVIETINGFYGHHDIDQHLTSHPDQPALWTENWTGWYDTYGYAHHIRTPQDDAYGVARFIAAGGTGVNYYMWHGGTNFGREGFFLQTTSYDYDAPLNEFGLPTTKSQHLGRLNHILHTNAHLLLSQPHAAPQSSGPQRCIYTYKHDRNFLTFLCNDAAEPATLNFEKSEFNLAPRSVLLLNQDGVLFNTAEIASSDIVLPALQTQLSSRDTITRIAWHEEPFPTSWPHKQSSLIHSKHPVEQLHFTLDDSDYCWYMTKLVVPPLSKGEGTLTLTEIADVAHIFVDGKLQATSSSPLLEDRGPLSGASFTQSFGLSVEPGEHDLAILCCSLGLIKGDWMIGNANMVEERKGLWGSAQWNGEKLQGSWSIQPGLLGERDEIFNACIQSSWQDNWQQASRRPLRWWRVEFNRPDTDGPLALDLKGMNKGIAWLNGRCIGRYWLTPGTATLLVWMHPAVSLKNAGTPTQRYYHLPAEWLQPNNVLVLFEELGGDPSSIALCPIQIPS